LILVLAVVTARAQGVPDPAHALAGAQLASALQSGGFVIYFRHADTGRAYVESGVDLKRCDTQRNLNGQGKADAREIGKQFRRLRIPVDDVLSSEYCRCWQTAQLAFGRHEINEWLTGADRAPRLAELRARKARELRRMLSTPPPAGTNTILISHGFNLLDAENYHLGTQGEAAVYRPDGNGAHHLVARLRPGEWSELP
jgi:hypothetical protein